LKNDEAVCTGSGGRDFLRAKVCADWLKGFSRGIGADTCARVYNDVPGLVCSFFDGLPSILCSLSESSERVNDSETVQV
jgi:hypothetical protein